MPAYACWPVHGPNPVEATVPAKLQASSHKKNLPANRKRNLSMEQCDKRQTGKADTGWLAVCPSVMGLNAMPLDLLATMLLTPPFPFVQDAASHGYKEETASDVDGVRLSRAQPESILRLMPRVAVVFSESALPPRRLFVEGSELRKRCQKLHC